MSGSDAILVIAGVGALGFAVWQWQKSKSNEAEFDEAAQVIPTALQVESGATGNKTFATIGALAGLWDMFKGNGSSQQVAVSTSGAYPAPSGLSGLLDVIGAAEAPHGYDTVYNGSKVRPSRPITQMTVTEVLEWQRQSIAAGSVSSAAGRYQIINKTLRKLVDMGVLSPTEKFSPAAQDRAARALMEGRGLSDYQSGRISATEFANNLSKEWAGLPVATGNNAGKSYYDGYAGNSATTTVERVISAIRGIG